MNIDLHLWVIKKHGAHERLEGSAYGHPRYRPDGVRIISDLIVETVWTPDGYDVTTADGNIYRLCQPERSAELIAKGYEHEQAYAKFLHEEANGPEDS